MFIHENLFKELESNKNFPNEIKKILIIEDNRAEANLLRMYLEEYGYKVNVAANGKDGIHALKEFSPDLVTVDLLMPSVNGFQFLEMKSNLSERYTKIPVIVISAFCDDFKNASVTAEAVLCKPVISSELIYWIKNLLPKNSQSKKLKPKILLIDDDPKAIKVLNSFLPNETYEVISAFNGADGIELAQIEKPDLVILDLIMPNLSGFEVLKILNEDQTTSNIPICILTSKILNESDKKILEEGAESVNFKGNCSKPLIEEINRILMRS